MVSYLERFKKKLCSIKPTKDCWLWPGISKNTYGQLHRKKQSPIRAHIVSWKVFKGTWPAKGMEVCHTCDIKSCVNPHHLFLGSHKDNMADAASKGLFPRGSKHYHSKLSRKEVTFIKNSSLSGKLLANRFGVSPPTICDIRKGRTWRYVIAHF